MRFKKTTAVSLVVLFLLSGAVFAAEYRASSKSNKYHYPSCQWAQRIKPRNLIVFESPEEAVRAGYVPCKVCRPPWPGRVEKEQEDNYKSKLQFVASER